MSQNLITNEAVYSEEFFVKSLGRVSINKGWNFYDGWQRILGVCREKEIIFVSALSENTHGVSIYKSKDLLEVAEQLKIVSAPEGLRIKLPSEAVLISISPKETHIAFSLANMTTIIYDIDSICSDPRSELLHSFDFNDPCRDLIWATERDFVFVSSKGQVFEANFTGQPKEWPNCDKVIAVDVHVDCSAWVASSKPSTVYISDGLSADLTTVFPESALEVIVNGIKILKKGTLVASVVHWDKTKKQREQMKLVILKWSDSEISIYPTSEPLHLTEKVEKLDPVLNCPLAAVFYSKWSAWLISCTAEGLDPHRLFLEDGCSFLILDESFPWPIKNNGEDNVLLGVGLIGTLEQKIKRNSNEGEERTAILHLAAADDGHLVLSAFSKDVSDHPLEEESSEAVDSGSEPISEVKREVETIEMREQETFNKSAVPARTRQLRENPVFHEGVSPASSSVSQTKDHRQESQKTEQSEASERQDKLQLADIIQDFEKHRLDHIQNFRQMRRLAEMTKVLKLRTVDLFLKGRQQIHKLEENEVDSDILQQAEYTRKLKTNVSSCVQILEKVKIVLTGEVDNLKLKIDAEETVEALKQEEAILETEIVVTSKNEDLEHWIESKLSDLMDKTKATKRQDLGGCLKHLRQEPIMTKLNQNSAARGESSDKMWKVVSAEEIPWRNLSLISSLPQLPSKDLANHILCRKRGTDGSLELCWRTPSELEHAYKPEEEDQNDIVETDSTEFELCSEREIEQILELQEQAKAKQNSASRDDPNQNLTEKEQKQEMLFSKVLLHNDSSIQGVSQDPVVKLKLAVQAPSLKKFLKNLGREDEIQDLERRELELKSQSKERVSEASARQETQIPQTSVSTPQPILDGAPQLGSLQNPQNARFGSSSVASGSGFSAYAKTGNVFQSIAQSQSGTHNVPLPAPQAPPQFMNSAFLPGNKPMNPDLFKMRK